MKTAYLSTFPLFNERASYLDIFKNIGKMNLTSNSSSTIPQKSYYRGMKKSIQSNELALSLMLDQVESLRKLISNTDSLIKAENINKAFVDEQVKKMLNIRKLKEISELEYNWNGNSAAPFSSLLIGNSFNIINTIIRQPDLFPTARNSIQIEYEKADGSYLEFEIFENYVEVFHLGKDDEEFEDKVDIDTSIIDRYVLDFYGQ